jgi:hypothetical protein
VNRESDNGSITTAIDKMLGHRGFAEHISANEFWQDTSIR